MTEVYDPSDMELSDAERRSIDVWYRADESECLQHLDTLLTDAKHHRPSILLKAQQTVKKIRQNQKLKPLESLIIQYRLSTDEGVALMCLAEALIRIPDDQTIDAMIRDKIADQSWSSDQAASSLFATAAGWGLLLTGKILSYPSQSQNLWNSLHQAVARLGIPIIRKIVQRIMLSLGQQFVLGETLTTAIENSRKAPEMRYSYDMLGEAALTEKDAERYQKAYLDAIAEMSDPDSTENLFNRPNISIKLSALYPRYEVTQGKHAVRALTERLKPMVECAIKGNVTLCLDAEECDRLMLSLSVFKALFTWDKTKDWPGLGLAVQAYQKRGYSVVEWLVQLAQVQKKKIMIRLVKGAYWDSEIKWSQQLNAGDYPVFTRKSHTDLSYLACAQLIINSSDHCFGQFATHNAYTVAMIEEMMPEKPIAFEFQCLHGMGVTLYRQLKQDSPEYSVRIYAPVGPYKELLPYLVRRLLENGANTSFVNQLMDERNEPEEVVCDPWLCWERYHGASHPGIPHPVDILGERRNSRGRDLTHEPTLINLSNQYQETPLEQVSSQTVSKVISKGKVSNQNPSCLRDDLGEIPLLNIESVDQIVEDANSAQSAWQKTPVEKRAECLRNMADELESDDESWLHLLIREAGKSWDDAVAEVREAVDFLRYYADEAETQMRPIILPGPTGERNTLSLHPRGVMLCISPWNFPVAIFMGQIAAALVVGNAVIAKPALQTAILAHRITDLGYRCGIPKGVWQTVFADIEVSSALTKAPGIHGVLFTGSTQTARTINQTLAARAGPIIPLVAETGGLNAMLVDSTALPEQVVQDVLISAFQSAGQRCSALRVLYLQDDIADDVITMLKGAMQMRRVGHPSHRDTDIGPIIDRTALDKLQKHQAYLDKKGTHLATMQLPEDLDGHFFAPCAYEISNISVLPGEVFGPILHVIRYSLDNLEQVLEEIRACGYGLTMGIHSRMTERMLDILQRSCVGNTYVNRDTIGAMVGVQPFGGEGLSGTGPKAGGPNYLKRLCVERTVTINTAAVGGNTELMELTDDAEEK